VTSGIKQPELRSLAHRSIGRSPRERDRGTVEKHDAVDDRFTSAGDEQGRLDAMHGCHHIDVRRPGQ